MEIAIARGRITGPVALLVAVGLVCLVAAYGLGLVKTLGSETRHVTFSGYASGTKSGSGFGLKHMLFFEGQIFVAQYDADVREGSLRIGILETFGPFGRKPHHVEAIKASGSGEVVYRIPKTSIYSIYFDGSVLGSGSSKRYDIKYTVRWGTR
jgi:hypothetical protein